MERAERAEIRRLQLVSVGGAGSNPSERRLVSSFQRTGDFANSFLQHLPRESLLFVAWWYSCHLHSLVVGRYSETPPPVGTVWRARSEVN